MFTGIIQEVGTIEDRTPFGAGVRLRVHAPASSRGLEVGQSISVNGTCLTVVHLNGASFELEAVEETLKKTKFGSCSAGDGVNLELPMRIDGRLDGHLVMGHVDAVGEIVGIEILESSRLFTLRIPPEFACYCVRTGSIAVDGVSLTIARIAEERVGVSIIPHTLQNTIFQHYRVGDLVNLEFDIVGKYVERMMHPPVGEGVDRDRSGFFTEQHLRELGF
jgi:riboflavin synthase